MTNLLPSRVFVTSDTHFNHANVIKYANRPYFTVDEMNAALIDNWNKVVRPCDIVIHCGDFAFTHYSRKKARVEIKHLTDQLNGHKILILGNHDLSDLPYTECGFEYFTYNHLPIGEHLVFCHIREVAERDGVLTNQFCYYGHLHNTDLNPVSETSRNICIEMTNYTPLDITYNLTTEEISEILKLVKINKEE